MKEKTILDYVAMHLKRFPDEYNRDKIRDYWVPRHFMYYRGATTQVLAPVGKDYVIKFRRTDVNLYGAHSAGGNDYCAAASIIYQRAQEAGVDQFFAPVTLVGQILFHNSQVTIYTQPKIDKLYDEIRRHYDWRTDPREKMVAVWDKLEQSKENYSSLPSLFGADVLIQYGEEAASKLLDFIRELGLTDLHSANCGTINGMPVIIDYSGYYEHF